MVWSEFIGDVIALSKQDGGTPVVAFIHYSGHGATFKSDKHTNTHIAHKEPGTFTNLQKLATKLALSPNVFVFLLMSCCRNVIQTMSEFTSAPLGGQIYIGFGCKLGRSAIAVEGRDGMSNYTYDFVNYAKEKEALELPQDIL